MADEITVSIGLRCNNGNFVQNPPTRTEKFDQTTALGSSLGVTIGTSEETIAWGDVAPGYVRMTNLDATNFVSFGVVTANLDFELEANGGMALVKMATGAALIMQADTADCNVLLEALNL